MVVSTGSWLKFFHAMSVISKIADDLMMGTHLNFYLVECVSAILEITMLTFMLIYFCVWFVFRCSVREGFLCCDCWKKMKNIRFEHGTSDNKKNGKKRCFKLFSFFFSLGCLSSYSFTQHTLPLKKSFHQKIAWYNRTVKQHWGRVKRNTFQNITSKDEKVWGKFGRKGLISDRWI